MLINIPTMESPSTYTANLFPNIILHIGLNFSILLKFQPLNLSYRLASLIFQENIEIPGYVYHKDKIEKAQNNELHNMLVQNNGIA